MKKNKVKILLLLVTCYLSLVTAPSAQAQTMSNQNYIIQTESINAISDTKTNANNNTIDKLNPLVSEGVNYKVKSGFENLASSPPFSISLSSDLVDFGILSPTNPIIRTADLKIRSSAVQGYSVIVFENEPLTAVSPAGKTFIPDTTCDEGKCNTENAARWTNTLTYGFGYRCDNTIGTNCDNLFANSNFYKHFPNIVNNDDPQPLMTGVGSDNQAARISYKINISGTQAQGAYNNTITYIALPNF